MGFRDFVMLCFIPAFVVVFGMSSNVSDGFFVAKSYSMPHEQQIFLREVYSKKYIIKTQYMQPFPNQPQFWSNEDISGWDGSYRWKIELNQNYVIGSQGLLFNGMMQNPSFKNCAEMCANADCDMWIYERSGWCRVYKGSWILESLGPATGYNSNYHIVGKKR